MKLRMYILMATLLCITAVDCWGQNAEMGCDATTWSTLQRIKAEVDNGMGYNSLQELEKINGEMYKYQQVNNDKVSQAFVLSSSTLAELYAVQGEYYKADSLLNTFEILKKELTTNLNLRGVSFIEVDPINHKLLKDTKKTLLPFRHFLYSQGFLYYYMGNYEMAKKSLEDAKDLFIINKETTSVDYLKCLLLLSSICDDDIVLSKLYYNLAIDVFNKLEDKTNYAYLQAKLFYRSMEINHTLNQKEKAQKDWKEAIRICKENQFDNMDVCVDALVFYLFYYNKDDKESIRLVKELIPEVSQPFLKNNLLSGLLYVDNEDNVDLYDQFNSVIKVCNKKWSYHFSEMEIESRWTWSAITSLLIDNFKAYRAKSLQRSDMLGNAYDNVLFTKMFLMKRKQLFDKIKNAEFDLVGKQISQEKNITTISSYRIFLSQKEKEIIAENQERWNTGIESISPQYVQVRQALGKHEVAIEFTFMPDSAFQELFLCAFILGEDSLSPQLIKLCKLSEFNEYFTEIANVKNDYVDEAECRKHLRKMINSLYDDPSKIYDKLWKPIEDKGVLYNAKTIYYSPCGDVNKINLEALRTDTDERLMDKYTFRKVFTTADIAELKDKDKMPLSINSAHIYGNIDYNTSPENMIAKAKSSPTSVGPTEQDMNEIFAASTHTDYRDRTTRAQTFEKLEKTKYEANDVEKTLEKPNRRIKKLTGQDATEESFKALSRCSPDIIHIATHGFFMQANADRQVSVLGNRKGSTTKNDEMLYSGLALSGINNAWTGRPVNGVEDGILTAEEISWMDLSSCKLVVLSACETGLGTSDNVDGVFGLQRGFRLAGADKIVMSLWSVDDKATALLMKEFYRLLTEGKDGKELGCHEALNEAKRFLMNYSENEIYRAPYYWSGFVLLE